MWSLLATTWGAMSAAYNKEQEVEGKKVVGVVEEEEEGKRVMCLPTYYYSISYL